MGAAAIPVVLGIATTATIAGTVAQVRAGEEAASETRKAERQRQATVRRAVSEAEAERQRQRDLFAASVARRRTAARAAERATRRDVITGALGVIDGVQAERKMLLGV